jgi:hypothetical protein
MKTCKMCQESKPLEKFVKDPRCSDGTVRICNECKRLKNKAIRERNKATDAPLIQEKKCTGCKLIKPRSDFWADTGNIDHLRTTCKLCCTAQTYEWREKNPDKYNSYMSGYMAERPDARYATALRRYGITMDDYNKMLIDQEGKCAICPRIHDPSRKAGRLYVDHDHATGKVRALLCHNCNFTLGYAKEDPRILLECVAYLARHKAT